jgi:hypothetical protein
VAFSGAGKRAGAYAQRCVKSTRGRDTRGRDTRTHTMRKAALASDYNRGVLARAGWPAQELQEGRDRHGESDRRCCVAGVPLGGPSRDSPDRGPAVVHARAAAGTCRSRPGVAAPGFRVDPDSSTRYRPETHSPPQQPVLAGRRDGTRTGGAPGRRRDQSAACRIRLCGRLLRTRQGRRPSRGCGIWGWT